MSIVSLEFFQRWQNGILPKIKSFVESKDPNSKGTSIATGTNLNNLTTTGVYYIANDTIAGQLVNLPLSVSGKIMVGDNGNSGLVQIYIPNQSPRIFQRVFYSNAWTAWEEYGKKSKLVTQTLTAGETSVTFTSAYITATSMLDVYTNPNVPYSSMEGSVGTCTVTFEEQESNITVVLEIKEQ